VVVNKQIIYSEIVSQYSIVKSYTSGWIFTTYLRNGSFCFVKSHSIINQHI